MASIQHAQRNATGSATGRIAGMLVRLAWQMTNRGIVTIDAMLARRRSRLSLQRLDDRMLKDIGVTRADVFAETRKSFWRG